MSEDLEGLLSVESQDNKESYTTLAGWQELDKNFIDSVSML